MKKILFIKPSIKFCKATSWWWQSFWKPITSTWLPELSMYSPWNPLTKSFWTYLGLRAWVMDLQLWTIKKLSSKSSSQNSKMMRNSFLSSLKGFKGYLLTYPLIPTCSISNQLSVKIRIGLGRWLPSFKNQWGSISLKLPIILFLTWTYWQTFAMEEILRQKNMFKKY